VISHPTCQWKS